MNENMLDRLSLSVPPMSVKLGAASGASKPVNGATNSFASILAKVQQGQTLKFSSHAEARLQQRGVALTPADVAKLQQAVDQAGQKGSKDVYVVYGEAGFVVNVPNRTVVTAMLNRDQPVVTNIDSVVVLSGPDH